MTVRMRRLTIGKCIPGRLNDRVPQLAELLLCMVAAVIQVNELAARERNALELSPLRGSGPHVRFLNAESDTAPRVQPVALAGG